ncbi:MAG: hypothetical protein NT141_01890 [candidate division WWE3 bacterium]|nr:hypothetical protein [candidate division WWE3 bacterium]
MNGKEKLYLLLNRIEDARVIAPSGQPALLDPSKGLYQNYSGTELPQLLTKLEKDEKVLKVLKVPTRIKSYLDEFDPYDHADDGCWHLQLLPAFDRYFLKIQQEPEYQRFTGKKPVTSPEKLGSSTLMPYEEKLGRIVKAIIEARKATRKDQPTTLHTNANSGLNYLDNEEIRNILLQLQDEKIIKVRQITNRLLPLSEQPINPSLFYIDVLDGFDTWYEGYQIKQKGKIENLSATNFGQIYSVLAQIDDQLQLSQSSTLNLPFIRSLNEIEGYDSHDIDELADWYLTALNYLQKIGVIKDYSHSKNSVDAEVQVDVNNFLDTWETAKLVEQKRGSIEPVLPTVTKPSEAQKPLTSSYNDKTSTLHIQERELKLQKDRFRTNLIALLMKSPQNKKKDWSWDEVVQQIEGTDDEVVLQKCRKKFYPACDGLAKAIAQKTGINDFLDYTQNTVHINPKYI